ncbi:MAG: hypothetical protein MUC63_00115 [Planctomycetes bacterium]|nr:hypothetical protein [Planctomycetota bacterium]
MIVLVVALVLDIEIDLGLVLLIVIEIGLDHDYAAVRFGCGYVALRFGFLIWDLLFTQLLTHSLTYLTTHVLRSLAQGRLLAALTVER